MNNKIIIQDIHTQENITGNYGLRTYYDNSNKNANEKLTFRISVLEKPKQNQNPNQTISASDFKYEPYYISSSTEVTQNQNHTLTAIWEKN